MKEFHQLEVDLLQFPTKPRPTAHGDQGFDNLEPIHGPGLRTKSEKMVRLMKALLKQLANDRAKQAKFRKDEKPFEDVPDRQFTDLWTLNPTTCVDWREEHRLQNATREWLKYATFTIVEITIAESYRQALLDSSAAAAFLRNTFKHVMDPFCMRRTYGSHDVPGKVVKLEGWCYPDPYTTPANTSPLDINMANLISTREGRRTEATERKQLTMFMSKAQAMRMFMSTLTSDCLDDAVRAAFVTLESVSA